MQRLLVVHLPAFRLERCGYQASELVALTAEQKNAVRLVALTPAALEWGLHVGMSAVEARARQPALILEPLEPEREWEDRLTLVARFGRLSDRAAPLWCEDIALEIGATAHLFGGEQGIVSEARRVASACGHLCRIAVADDVLAASALAAWSAGDVIAPPGEADRLLAALPIEALRPSGTLLEALQTLGIERIGQWARLDPASVAGRFGEEGTRLHRVARGRVASGALPSHNETEPASVSVVLGGPTTTLEPILFVLGGVLARLAEALAARDALVVRLALRLTLERGSARLLRVRVGRPTRDPEVLQRVLRVRLEGLQLHAPAVALALEVEETAPDGGTQPGIADRVEAAEHPADLLARLADGIGEDALVTAVPVDDWRPELTWRARPWALREQAAPAAAPRRVDPVEVLWRWERDLPLPRPTLLLPRPRPIDVRVDRERPVGVHLDRGWEPVLRVLGPERLEGGWWSDDGGFFRDYWVVETLSGAGWIYVEQGRWYWHGWFD